MHLETEYAITENNKFKLGETSFKTNNNMSFLRCQIVKHIFSLLTMQVLLFYNAFSLHRYLTASVSINVFESIK